MNAEDIKPGYYLAGNELGRVYCDGKELWFSGSYKHAKVSNLVNSNKETFTRLVPAEEVERAFREGHAAGYSIGCMPANTPGSVSCDFAISRAKRISEGLE